eukprot:TRINITY_DN1303_c0_g2_i8.p1 TRINITY_DN1303_c0_g2~~TRINITY_DN1303_c0_g2_i8.p1  ORF type:complete len:250 (+),score=49.22 TRINITY_DN1303_c0_g2_i8:438-1187(+)
MIQGKKGIVAPNCLMDKKVSRHKSKSNDNNNRVKFDTQQPATTEVFNKAEARRPRNKSGIQIERIIDVFSKRMGFEFEEDYYRKKVRHKTKPPEEQLNKASEKELKSDYLNKYVEGKTNDLTLDTLLKVMSKKSKRVETKKEHKAYNSLSPYRNPAISITKQKTSNKNASSNIQRITADNQKVESPVTIIQTPQINNVNNYNNISIQTVAINQDDAKPQSLLVPHPPPLNEARTNRFRIRKYKLTNDSF